MGETDLCMQEYLRDKSRFADLFNGVFFSGRAVVRPEELSEASEKYAEGAAGHRSLRVRDVKMNLYGGASLRILAVENQSRVDYIMPLRCMEYDVFEYRKQIVQIKRENKREAQAGKRKLRAEERLCGVRRSDRLSPVYTICLYHGEEEWDGPMSLREMMDFGEEEDELKELFADYPLRLFCVNRQQNFDEFHTDLKELFRALNCRGNRDKMKRLMTEEASYAHLSGETAELLSVMLNMPRLWEDRERYMKKQGEKEEYDMCRAMREWMEEERNEGIQQGMQQGIWKGIQQGKAEGIREKQAIIIRNMLARGFSDEDICALAECDLKTVEEIRRKA